MHYEKTSRSAMHLFAALFYLKGIFFISVIPEMLWGKNRYMDHNYQPAWHAFKIWDSNVSFQGQAKANVHKMTKKQSFPNPHEPVTFTVFTEHPGLN